MGKCACFASMRTPKFKLLTGREGKKKKEKKTIKARLHMPVTQNTHTHTMIRREEGEREKDEHFFP